MKKIAIILALCIVAITIAGCAIEKDSDRYKMLNASFLGNEYYEVESPFTVYKADKVVSISGNVTVKTPYTEWPGLPIFTNLPASAQNIYVTIPERFNNGVPVRVYIDTDGTVYLRYGKTDSLYDISISYIIQ